MKIGFMGGSFNPPTNAHINLAKKTLEQCGLDKIILVPMNDNYEKTNLAKAKDRLKMLEIACQDIENIEPTDIELKINKKITTKEALNLIEKQYPNDEKYYILGADNYEKIKNEKKHKYIILERNEINLEETKNIYKIIKNEEYKNTSATIFRNLLKQEKTEKQDIIPQEVYNYIKKYKIYI